MPHCPSPLPAAGSCYSHSIPRNSSLQPNSSTYPGAVFATTKTCTIRWDLQGSWGIKWSYSFLCLPPSMLPPPECPHTWRSKLRLHGHQLREWPQDMQATSARPGRQDGRAKAGGRYFGKQRKHNHNTHTHSGANLQSRNASPCQELGYFPPSSQLAALS